MGYINSGKQDGAKVHIGGERHEGEGYFIKPTIFTDVKPDMKIMQEEIFGPVCSVVKFKTEEGSSCCHGLMSMNNGMSIFTAP